MEKTQDNNEMEIDLMEIGYALKKHALIIVAALLAGALLAGVYTKVMATPVYRSTATMLVIPQGSSQTSLSDLQLGNQLTKDYSMLITSRSVLQKVIDSLGLDMSYEALGAMVSVNNPEETRILEVTVSSADPELAKKIVDELTEESSAFISEQMEVAEPKIIEQGRVPEAPSSPDLRKNIATGALAGFVIAAGIIVLLAVLDDNIRSEEDIEKYLGIPVLASIPDRKDYITGKGKKQQRKRRKRRRHK